MSETPFLTTERLELWKPVAGDRAQFIEINAHLANLRDVPHFNNAHEGLKRLLRNAGSWAMYGYGPLMLRRRGEPEILGACGPFYSWRGFGKGMDDVPEAGWSIAPEHCGQGYATESMSAILAWFDRAHGSLEVVCLIDEANAASQAVARKLGFVAYDKHIYQGSAVELYRRGI